MTLSVYLRRTLTFGLGLLLAFASLAGAQALRSGIHSYPARGVKRPGAPMILKSAADLVYHGGPVITSAHVVFIFWGPSFNDAASPDYSYARTLQSFRNQFGTTPEYNTITQYSGSNGTIALTNLAAGTPDWFDTSTPPTAITDAMAQGEVNTYLSTRGLDANAIYEVILPTTSYSSVPTLGGTSCGGTPLAYCAYHGDYPSGANVVKYSVQPYPSCSGCQVSGWSAVQNQERSVTHETREAVTDPQIDAWFDDVYPYYEADDKCVFSPAPFIGTGGYSYQYEWSNAVSGCVASTPIAPSYAGTFEHTGCDTLSGWAADRNRPNTAINVSIYNNGTLLTTILANGSRPDVGATLGDNGLHGFSIPTPLSLQDGNSHLISVRFESSSTNLASSPTSLTCAPPPNYAGNLDHAGCDTLAGWAADDNRLNTPINVSVYDNGALVTTVLANLSRPDVGIYLGDNGLHGFSIPTPLSFQNGLSHQVSVRFESSATNLSLSPATLTCNNPAPVADFSFTCTGLSCSFNGTGSTGTGLSYAWSFGDSGTGAGATINHNYPNVSGTNVYTATLTVTDSWGRQSSRSKKVSVSGDAVAAAENYFAVAPCRILDTRNTTILTSDQPRTITVAGNCGIPSTAKAISLNVTAISPTGSGKITLYPGNLTASWSGERSSLNFAPATSPRANSAVIQLATNGAGTMGINAVVTGSPGQVHLVVDIQGYFSTDTTPAAGAQGPLGYQTLPICRLADTRTSSPLAAGTVRTFTAQGICGVPAGAAVGQIQAGVTAPTYGGYFTLYPSNISTPTVSTINFQAGISALRNSARVNLSSTTPDFAVYFGASAGASVNATFDVNGYFKLDAPLKYHPVAPCRAVDTTDAALGGPALVTDVVRTFQIQGSCGVPVGAKAVVARLKVSVPTSTGVMSVYPSNVSLPPYSTIQFDANEPELSMGVIVPLSTLVNDLAVSPNKMTAGGTVHLLIDVFGYFQ
jgi:hypothetical protein